MLDVVQGTLKTNFYNDDRFYYFYYYFPSNCFILYPRYALSLRVNPKVMFTEQELTGPNAKEVPFGVFFSHGRYFILLIILIH